MVYWVFSRRINVSRARARGISSVCSTEETYLALLNNFIKAAVHVGEVREQLCQQDLSQSCGKGDECRGGN